MRGNLVSVIPDNTETYFIPLGYYRHKMHEPIYFGGEIFRRIAVCVKRSERYPDIFSSLFMDNYGEVHNYDEGEQDSTSAYDTFTVGVPVRLSGVKHIEYAVNPENVMPLLMKLKKDYGITFIKPEKNIVRLKVDVSEDEKRFGFYNVNDDNDILPFGESFGIWEKEYNYNSPASLVEIGNWLGLFRFAFDMPALRYDLDFSKTNEHTPEDWNKEMVDEFGYPPYEEQRRIEQEREAAFKTAWEEAIDEHAAKFYEYYRVLYE